MNKKLLCRNNNAVESNERKIPIAHLKMFYCQQA